MTQWQLQEAKAKLSKLVKLVETEGPQEITVHGEAKAVLVSIAEYTKLKAREPDLLGSLRRFQLQDGEIDWSRDQWDQSLREIDL